MSPSLAIARKDLGHDPRAANGLRVGAHHDQPFRRLLRRDGGAAYGANEGASIDELLADLGGPLDDNSDESGLESAEADNELVKFVNKVIVDGGPPEVLQGARLRLVQPDRVQGPARIARTAGGRRADQSLTQERALVVDLFAAAVETGMRTLKMDGMEKIMLGLTDLKQVRSVCIK
jgi:hypothetical protein